MSPAHITAAYVLYALVGFGLVLIAGLLIVDKVWHLDALDDKHEGGKS